MKKVIDISLTGVLFHLEEDAYDDLKKYLKAIRKSLTEMEDTDEIMHEIEARIAELLLEKQNFPEQVINKQNIIDVITIMGKPEDYNVREEKTVIYKKTKKKKSLFRDFDRSVFGGVAAGLAHYLGMNIIIVRLIFIILLFASSGTMILVYLILWIVIPKAKTASDKLKMRGEDVNVEKIIQEITTDNSNDK